MIWQLIPKKGITTNELSISFDDQRTALREALGKSYSLSTSQNFPDEDDFQREGIYIRVRYNDDDRVKDIEFLGGDLFYQDISIHDGTTFEKIESAFAEKGLTFRDTQWFGDGKDCVELEISIATREEVGGDSSEIEWVILSNDLE